jgi:hypothetical protein
MRLAISVRDEGPKAASDRAGGASARKAFGGAADSARGAKRWAICAAATLATGKGSLGFALGLVGRPGNGLSPPIGSGRTAHDAPAIQALSTSRTGFSLLPSGQPKSGGVGAFHWRDCHIHGQSAVAGEICRHPRRPPDRQCNSQVGEKFGSAPPN